MQGMKSNTELQQELQYFQRSHQQMDSTSTWKNNSLNTNESPLVKKLHKSKAPRFSQSPLPSASNAQVVITWDSSGVFHLEMHSQMQRGTGICEWGPVIKQPPKIWWIFTIISEISHILRKTCFRSSKISILGRNFGVIQRFHSGLWLEGIGIKSEDECLGFCRCFTGFNTVLIVKRLRLKHVEHGGNLKTWQRFGSFQREGSTNFKWSVFFHRKLLAWHRRWSLQIYFKLVSFQ